MTSWFGAGLVAVERRHAAAAFLTVPGLAVAHALPRPRGMPLAVRPASPSSWWRSFW